MISQEEIHMIMIMEIWDLVRRFSLRYFKIKGVGAKEIDFTGLIEEKFVYQAPKNDKMFDIFEDQGEEDEKSLPRVSKAPEFDLNSYGENKISLNINLKEKDRPRLAHDFSYLIII